MADTLPDSDVPEAGGETAYFALRPRVPIRAWVLALIILAGGVAAVLFGWPADTVLLVLGAVLVVAGLSLGIAAGAFVSSRTLHIVLSPEGFEVSGPGYHKAGQWIDVSAVSATPDGARLVISQGHVDRTFIQAPSGRVDDQMRAITAHIRARLGTGAPLDQAGSEGGGV